MKQKFNEWIEMNGGEDGSLYMTFSDNLNIDVHTCGYAFCKKCKKKLNEFAGKKLANYERELVEEFIK